MKVNNFRKWITQGGLSLRLLVYRLFHTEKGANRTYILHLPFCPIHFSSHPFDLMDSFLIEMCPARLKHMFRKQDQSIINNISTHKNIRKIGGFYRPWQIEFSFQLVNFEIINFVLGFSFSLRISFVLSSTFYHEKCQTNSVFEGMCTPTPLPGSAIRYQGLASLAFSLVLSMYLVFYFAEPFDSKLQMS